MEFRRILITGGCGFLGQYLTRDLLGEFPELKIKILDLKPNPNSLFDFSDSAKVELLFNRDICDYDSIESEFRDVDVVIHLAGLVSFSLQDKNLLERVNVEGTRNVLRAVAVNGIESLVHISSVAALGYGDDKSKAIDETFVFDWDIARAGKKYYMLTKHLADVEVERYVEKGLNCVVLYPGLMFGPGDLANSARLVRAIKRRKIPFNMPGGTNIIDVRDVSRGILTVLRKGITKGSYLLSGYNLTFQEINRTIAEALSVKRPRLTLPRVLNPLLFNLLLLVESMRGKRLELTADNLDSAFKFRYFDNAKAKEELGWEPEIAFERTIKDTIKWMDENGHFER